MTTHYTDLCLLPDPEFSQAHLMGALMDKLHRALVRLRASHIGVSFPQHVPAPPARRSLGRTLRLHGTPEALRQLLALDWLQAMRDHVQQPAAVLPAPHGAPRMQVRRRQFKTNPERLRRRRMRRKGETAEQAAAAIPDSAEQRPNLPFLPISSLSSGQRFCLFIEHATVQAAPAQQGFNSYGLSLGGTVPRF